MRKRLKIPIITVLYMVILGIGAIPTGAIILHVPDEFETIQEGILSAGEGDTVLVDSGIYEGNIDFLAADITVASRFLLTGDSTFIQNTEIRPQIPGMPIVTIAGGQSRNAILCGFTISGGQPPQGSGIFCSGSSPTIEYNYIWNNCVQADGGGIYIHQGAPDIRFNKIFGN